MDKESFLEFLKWLGTANLDELRDKHREIIDVLQSTLRNRCETGSNAKASESSSPRKPEGPGGFPTEETCKASRTGVESSGKPRPDPLVGSGRADGDGRGAEGNHRAGAESERAMNGPARLRSESGARSVDVRADAKRMLRLIEQEIMARLNTPKP